MRQQECVLEEKICNRCNRCSYCDIDKDKICDNCCECLEMDSMPAYSSIKIDEVVPPQMNKNGHEDTQRKERKYRVRKANKEHKTKKSKY